MINDKHLRQTGRTTRMIVDAIGHVKHTRDTVVIVSANHTESKRLKDSLRYYLGFAYYRYINRFKFVVILECNIGCNFDIRSYKMLGITQYKVFFDHFALETHFRDILTKVHEYDMVIE